jgi:hypothetical protein
LMVLFAGVDVPIFLLNGIPIPLYGMWNLPSLMRIAREEWLMIITANQTLGIPR